MGRFSRPFTFFTRSALPSHISELSLKDRAAVSRSSQRGAVTIWVAVLLGFMLIGFGGLVYDGAGMQTRRSELVNASWTLARAGLSETRAGLDGVEIDVDGALDLIHSTQSKYWPETDITVEVSGASITVNMSDRYQPKMLSSLGLERWDIDVSATAALVEHRRSGNTAGSAADVGR